MTDFEIRPVAEADLPEIARIWNAMIRDSAATFTTVEKTSDTLSDWLGAGRAAGWPRLAAHAGGRVAGFAAASPFRPGPGYAETLEHSIILAREWAGTGLARALMNRLEQAARAAGAHSLIAGISGENRRAVAFHARCGFREVGRVPEAGVKFGRRLDLVLMQKML